MKKLAILLSIVLLVSAVASLGVTTASAEETTAAKTIYKTDFSTGVTYTTPAGMAPAANGNYNWFGKTAGDKNGIENGKWVCSAADSADYGKNWVAGMCYYSDELVWSADESYTFAFKYSINETVSAGGKYQLRMFLEVIPADGPTFAGNNTSTYRTYRKVITEGTSITAGEESRATAFTLACSAISAGKEGDRLRVIFLSTQLTEYTIESFLVRNSNTEDLIYETFEPDANGLSPLVADGTYSYSNHYNGTRVNRTVDGAWTVKETEANLYNKNDELVWRGAFGTYNPTVPMSYSEDRIYTVKFDWSIPSGYIAGGALRAIMEPDTGMGNNVDGKPRIAQYKVIANESAAKEGASSGSVEWKVRLSGEEVEEGTPLRIVFRGKGLTEFSIDNLEIIEENPSVFYKGLQMRAYNEGDEYTALRFGFDLKCTGVTKNENFRRVIADDATVEVDGNEYKLVDFGALLSTNPEHDLSLDSDDDIYGIRTYNLYEVAEDMVTYTVGVSNVPLAQPDKMLYVRSFVIYELADGTEKVLYGDAVSGCLNDVEV